MTSALHAVHGRPVGRKRAEGPLHAVPGDDRTRTALCGARVGGLPRTWPAQPLNAGEATQVGPGAGTCIECTELARAARVAELEASGLAESA